MTNADTNQLDREQKIPEPKVSAHYSNNNLIDRCKSAYLFVPCNATMEDMRYTILIPSTMKPKAIDLS